MLAGGSKSHSLRHSRGRVGAGRGLPYGVLRHALRVLHAGGVCEHVRSCRHCHHDFSWRLVADSAGGAGSAVHPRPDSLLTQGALSGICADVVALVVAPAARRSAHVFVLESNASGLDGFNSRSGIPGGLLEIAKHRTFDMWTYFQNIFSGVVTTLIAMRITLRHLFIPAVTLQYPTVKWNLPDRARARLFNKIEDCIGCGQCARVCPTDCIDIETEKRGKDEPEIFASDGTPIKLRTYVFDIDMT